MAKKKRNNSFRKVLLLSLACGFLSGTYAIIRPLKISIFFSFIGKEYYPFSKMLMILVALPSMLLYAKLVDRLKRHQLIYVLFGIYTAICLTFAAFFFHPVIGLKNTTTSPYRILGWLFMVAMDLYPTFIFGTIWAFINSISTPDFAKKNYGFIVASTKIGGIIAAGLSLYMTTNTRSVTNLSILLILAGLFILLATGIIGILKKRLPASELVGYEHSIATTSQKDSPHRLIAGLKFIITTPYVFGIFLLFYCYEIIFTLVEYQSTILFSIKTNNNAILMGNIMFFCMIASQAIGFIFSLLGTSVLLKKLTMRHALLVMPMLCAITAITVFLSPTFFVMQWALILLPALNFGFNAPLREMLYIPTNKDIQFKSKAWIDSFGRSLSKISGSGVNMLYNITQYSTFLAGNTALSFAIAIMWTMIAFAMGSTYERYISADSVKNS